MSKSLIFKGFTVITRALKTASLPLTGILRRTGGSIFSACLGLSFLLPSPASQAQTATQQIEAHVANHMQALVSSEAIRQGWQGVRHTVQINHLGNAEQLPICSQPLRLSAGQDNDIEARQRIQLNCPDTPGWSHALNAQASVYVQAVHAATQVERGATLNAAQLKLAEVALSKASRGFYTNTEEVSGQGAKRRIRPGQLITPALISAPLLVRRGEAVTIRASQDGIQAATKGQALSNGHKGEVIRVRNLSSEKVIDAQVLEPGIVTSTFN